MTSNVLFLKLCLIVYLALILCFPFLLLVKIDFRVCFGRCISYFPRRSAQSLSNDIGQSVIWIRLAPRRFRQHGFWVAARRLIRRRWVWYHDLCAISYVGGFAPPGTRQSQSSHRCIDMRVLPQSGFSSMVWRICSRISSVTAGRVNICRFIPSLCLPCVHYLTFRFARSVFFCFFANKKTEFIKKSVSASYPRCIMGWRVRHAG